MAIKKSELYSSLWASCDALRGGMDASQYKDYVLVMLFIKYVSDKFANQPDSVIVVPKGGSFKDIAALKGQKEIGEKMDIAIGELAKANDLQNVIDVVSFNDEEKLGKGKEMIDRLSDLVSIFENPALDFSKNRAEGDDILGDAYEYLMMHFATESGKSKGQFYTPAEVSRVLAKVIVIKNISGQSIYDPTCGSGSLLLKIAEECDHPVSLAGQEKDVATAALARMNMILHNNPTADIERGQSTLSNPLFLDKHGYLRKFDFVVANPPFSLKNWTQGFNPQEDEFSRFTGFGVPPEKNGDYAFLLHVVHSLKSTGKGAVILPHGVLFRGNAESEIRKNLINRGYIKGIIGFPANLFYGTGIPACVIVIDKEGAENRKGIFLIDAGKGFLKDGNKNRLREQDIHKIVDVFNKQIEIPGYSRLVPIEEISDAKNDFNLNIPRYIDSQEKEDLQDIDAHLRGGIPNADIDALEAYWKVYPSLKAKLFGPADRKGYSLALVAKDEIRQSIFEHPEFKKFTTEMATDFEAWKNRTASFLKSLKKEFRPKLVIQGIAEDILAAYNNKPLLDKYDVYQHLMNYWKETMQDDAYLISADGWVAEPYRILEKNKKGNDVDKGWTCDLLPPALIIAHYFSKEKQALEKLEADKEALAAEQNELEEEHSGEEGFFADYDKVNKAAVQKRLKEIKSDKSAKEERRVLEKYLSLIEQQAEFNASIKQSEAQLDKLAYEKYKALTEADVKMLVVDLKWMGNMEAAIRTEMDRVSQTLTQRIKELVERYETTLPDLNSEVKTLEEKVNSHLTDMGFAWI